MPEVRFDDVMTVHVPQKNMTVPIDAKFLEVCGPGSVLVCGCVSDIPILVGAATKDGAVELKFAKQSKSLVQLVIRLTGIRKGYAGDRFPNRTQTQFEANEKFIRSAYNHE